MHKTAISLLFACLANSAYADWTAEWRGVWQHPEPMHSPSSVDVARSATGQVLAALGVGHHGINHAALARFAADGTFDWLREAVSGETIGMAALGDGSRAAIVDGSGADGARIQVRAYDVASGDLAWSDATRVGRFDGGAHRTATASNGDLLVRASDGGDIVVLRYSADGTPLSDWRWSSGQALASADDILALPDGGAMVSGRGAAIGGGYLTVRFAANGAVVFTDREDGELGNPLGSPRLAAVSDGIVVAGAPESRFGVFKAQAWKLSADGARAWTHALPNPAGDFGSLDITGIATRDDDVFVALAGDPADGFRLVRLDGADGAVLRDAQGGVVGVPTTLVQATNGRLLVGGFDFIDSSGHVGARIAEFDAEGAPCRASANLGLHGGVAAAGDGDGWLTLGTGEWIDGIGSDALVARYDADGPCNRGETIFANGFDATPADAPQRAPQRDVAL